MLDGLEERPYPEERARHLSVPKPTITAYLKNLEGRGLIARQIDNLDLRRHGLELTNSGSDTPSRARAILSGRYGERPERLTHDEQLEFERLLEKLCR